MRKRNLICVAVGLVSALAVIACGGPSTTTPRPGLSSQRAEIRDLFQRLQDAFNRGDAHTICFDLYASQDTLAGNSRRELSVHHA